MVGVGVVVNSFTSGLSSLKKQESFFAGTGSGFLAARLAWRLQTVSLLTPWWQCLGMNHK
jgi:hypothetical protein